MTSADATRGLCKPCRASQRPLRYVEARKPPARSRRPYSGLSVDSRVRVQQDRLPGIVAAKIPLDPVTRKAHTGVMTPEALAELKSRMQAARAAWQAECGKRLGNTPELLALVGPMTRLEGEYRMAKQGRFRKMIPAGHESCGRCGGFGGHNQWPGFVCFKCDGRGVVES
jgi:hypothetical protein